MLPLSQWRHAHDWLARPWLVVGKGPSSAHLDRFDMRPFYTMSLNHAVRELKVDVAHFIDLEALEASADAVRGNAAWLLIARRPHRNFVPDPKPLEGLLADYPVLREFSQRGRLVWYYHSLGPIPEDTTEPRIRVDYFSAEAALGVLAAIGVRTVRLVGVDGGTMYSERFADLDRDTRLANGWPSFNRQFLGIQRLAKEYSMDVGPLQEPLRIFVGADEKALVPARVLEYSIRKFASRPVEITPMLGIPVPVPKDPANRAATGFSFQRFLIPKLAGYRSKAVYLDSDMLVFADIAELFDAPMTGCRMACSCQQAPEAWRDDPRFHAGRQYSVLLLDCDRLDWDVDQIVRGLDEGRYTYRQLMVEWRLTPANEVAESIPQEWNSLEHFVAGRTRLLHYTFADQQPWVYRANPLGPIWRAFYREALAEGALAPELVEQGIAQGYLLPELAEDLHLSPSRRPAASLPQMPLEGVETVRHRADRLLGLALQAEAEMLRDELAKAKQQLVAIQSQHGQLQTQHGQLRTQHDQLQTEYGQLQTQAAHQQVQLSSLHTSLSWRVGRGVTKPLRMVRQLIAG